MSASEPQSVEVNKGHLGIRNFNERRILTLIRREHALPKAAIAKQTGLSAQSATIIMNRLEASQLVRRQAPQRGRVGQPIVPFELNPQGAYGIGLKVGRRSFDLTLVDFCGAVQATLNERFAYPTVDALMTFLKRGLPALTIGLSESQRQCIAGLGVAMPFEMWNWVEEAGAPAAELERWQSFDFSRHIEQLVGLPVFLCNDDTAACSAELTFGNPAHFSHFLYFFVGTFVGGGIVLNDQLFTGYQGNAGAVGSLPLFSNRNTATGQLINHASLYLLEQSLPENKRGTMFLDTTSWEDFGEPLEQWLNTASEGLAKAIVTCQAVLDVQGVVIDGTVPGPVKTQLINKVSRALDSLDWRGLNTLSVVGGNIGAKAQSIGSANLPLMANYYLETLNG